MCRMGPEQARGRYWMLEPIWWNERFWDPCFTAVCDFGMYKNFSFKGP